MGGETGDAPKSEGYKPWWAVDKEAWKEKFAVVTKLKSIRDNQAEPLPRWTEADIDKFAEEDPVNGSQIKLARQGATIANYSGLAGGVGTALYSYRYSRSAAGAALVFVFGATTCWALGEEAANFGLGLYKFDPLDSNLKFLEWWKKRQT
eukprot:jgi/Mesen1/7901/ME000420S07045